MLAAVVRRSVQAPGAAAMTQARCSSRALLNLPPLAPSPPRAATTAPSSFGQGVRASSFYGRPVVGRTFASAPAQPDPEPAPAAPLDKEAAKLHHEIDEWAATLEDTPQVRSAVVMALKEATLVVLKALDEDRFTAVCSAGPDRTAHMVPLKPGCDASFAAASSAQWPAVPLKKSKDEVLRFLTEELRVPLDEARDIFPCDKDHAFGVYYKDPTFAKRVEARMQQFIRYKIERKYAKHTTFKSCTVRGNHSPTAPVRSVVIAISKAGVRLPEIVFKQAQVALDGSFPAKAVGRIMDMLNEYQNYAELAPRAAKLAQEMRAVYQLAA